MYVKFLPCKWLGEDFSTETVASCKHQDELGRICFEGSTERRSKPRWILLTTQKHSAITVYNVPLWPGINTQAHRQIKPKLYLLIRDRNPGQHAGIIVIEQLVAFRVFKKLKHFAWRAGQGHRRGIFLLFDGPFQ